MIKKMHNNKITKIFARYLFIYKNWIRTERAKKNKEIRINPIKGIATRIVGS